GARQRHCRYVQPQVFSNRGVEHVSGCNSAQQSQATREATWCVAEFRVSRSGCFEYGLSHAAGPLSSFHYLIYPLFHRYTNLAIRIELGVGFQEVCVERRLRVCRLDDRDPDTMRAQLMVE